MQNIPNDISMKASKGDIDAFEKIYKAASNYVYNIAFRITGNKEAAEEVTQDVFLKIHANLKYFRYRSSVKTWIYRITVNTAINTIKRMSKELNRRTDYDDSIINRPASEKLKERINKEENEMLVKRLLDSLNPKQKACVVLRDMEGLSYKEIANTLNININTVRSRLKRAREKLLTEAQKRRDKNEV